MDASVRGWSGEKDLRKTTALGAGDEILQGQLIQAGIKSRHGFGQGTLETTVGVDTTGVGGGIKTLNDGGLALRLAEEPTDENLLRQSGKKDTTSAPASGLKITEPGEILNDLRQMMTRDVVGGGHLLNLKGTPLHGCEHEQAKGVIREEAELHDVSSTRSSSPAEGGARMANLPPQRGKARKTYSIHLKEVFQMLV
jgi:hypothetical protein